jgi:hypothetical protein
MNKNSFPINLIKIYQKKANHRFLSGKRPYYLPCEEKLGDHCAQMMVNDIQQLGIARGIRNHIKRCPKGAYHGILGLLSGAAVAALPFMLFSSDPCGCESFVAACGSCNNCLEGCSK